MSYRIEGKLIKHWYSTRSIKFILDDLSNYLTIVVNIKCYIFPGRKNQSIDVRLFVHSIIFLICLEASLTLWIELLRACFNLCAVNNVLNCFEERFWKSSIGNSCLRLYNSLRIPVWPWLYAAAANITLVALGRS